MLVDETRLCVSYESMQVCLVSVLAVSGCSRQPLKSLRVTVVEREDNMEVLIRYAADAFEAMQIATAITQAGGDVFSVTDSGGTPYKREIGRFIVWAKFKDSSHLMDIEKQIAKGRV